MSKRVGYARVSSKGQEIDGNSLESQERALLSAGADYVVQETYTGTTMDRPKLREVLSCLEEGDTLLISKLDRFARTASEGYEAIKSLTDRGVTVHILDMGIVKNDKNSNLLLTILFAFAEFERACIVERLNEGKEIAKNTNPNYKEGRKALEIPADFYGYCDYVAEGNMTVTAACKELGISRTMWYKWKNGCRA